MCIKRNFKVKCFINFWGIFWLFVCINMIIVYSDVLDWIRGL